MQSCIDSISHTSDTQDVSHIHKPDITWILSRISVPGHDVLTERLRAYATRYLGREQACGASYAALDVPGDFGRTERLRVYVRDIEFLLRGIPEDRRKAAITAIAATLARMWNNSEPTHCVSLERLAQSCETSIMNAARKWFASSPAYHADYAGRMDEMELEQRR